MNLFRWIHHQYEDVGLVKENWLDRSLTLSWWRSLSYRNQTIDLLCKLMDWFLYNRDVRHEIAHSTLMANSHHSWKRDYCENWFPLDCWFWLSSSSIIRDKLTCVLPKLAGVLSSTKLWERILFAANSADWKKILDERAKQNNH